MIALTSSGILREEGLEALLGLGEVAGVVREVGRDAQAFAVARIEREQLGERLFGRHAVRVVDHAGAVAGACELLRGLDALRVLVGFGGQAVEEVDHFLRQVDARVAARQGSAFGLRPLRRRRAPGVPGTARGTSVEVRSEKYAAVPPTTRSSAPMAMARSPVSRARLPTEQESCR